MSLFFNFKHNQSNRCPYAGATASGNVATEDVVYALESMGVRTGVDLGKILEVGEFISGVLGRPGYSKAANALRAKMNKKNDKNKCV